MGAAVIGVAACGATSAPSPAPTATTAGTSLTMDATGLGPCLEPWYTTCNYGIGIEGAGGDDHRGNFVWDQGAASPGAEGHGPNGPVGSTGTSGDVPAALGPGHWTVSFRLWYGSDAIQYVPVPGGTPRLREEDPFTPACSTAFDTGGTGDATTVALHVAFNGHACSVETQFVHGGM